MTVEFFLPANGSQENIYLNLKDLQLNFHFTLPTCLKIAPDDWDIEKQRPKNIYLKKFKKINVRLDALKKELTAFFALKKKKNQIPKKQSISRLVRKICVDKNIKHPEGSLLYCVEEYIESRKNLISHSTYKRYMVFYRLLERFEGFVCKKLNLIEINQEFVQEFMAFGKEETYSETTIYRTIHFVKTILNYAQREGIKTSVHKLEIREEKIHQKFITLTEAELRAIQQTEVSDDLQFAKDWLLISCYTGQRFSDFIGFTGDKLRKIDGRICLEFIQQKTKKEVLLPLHPVVLDIMNKYKGDFPPPLCMKKYNYAIKTIAELADLKEKIHARKRIGHRIQVMNTEKWNVLTSHIGRRSFATNFYGKIPTPLLMEATGHTTEQMFLRYIHQSNSEKALALGRFFER